MESRIIYESAKTYLHKVEWMIPTDNTDSEWIYFGTTPNSEMLQRLIYTYFNSEDLYIALGRHNSFETNQETVVNEIIPFIGTQDVSIWDSTFNKVVEFSKIGVYLVGNK